MNVVTAKDEEPMFAVGDDVRVVVRFPIGHYRVPLPVRGKRGVVEAILPRNVDNEEEAYGRNAGSKRHYYRVAILLCELWPDYSGARHDGLRIEIFETWLRKIG